MDLLPYLPPLQDSGPAPSLPSLLRAAGMSEDDIDLLQHIDFGPHSVPHFDLNKSGCSCICDCEDCLDLDSDTCWCPGCKHVKVTP